MATMQDTLAKAALAVGLIAPATMVLGALGTRFGFWSFSMGFRFLFTGAFVAAAVLVLGIAVLIFALRAGRTGDALPVGIGLVASVLALAVVGWQYRLATTVPPIHDISTDRVDPPAFSALVAARGGAANPLDYTAETATQQANGYPRIDTLRSDLPPAESLRKAAVVARRFGWQVVNEDPHKGIVEATETTFWFGFKDDVVVRVRASDGVGSLIDLRSVSRVGKSDLGANARRIERFLARFQEH